MTARQPYLRAPQVLLWPGPQYSDDVREFQGIPAIERAPSGKLWATWYGGGTGEGRFNYVMLVTSEDDGATWSKLKLVIDPDGDGPVRAFDPCLWHDPVGRLWLFWAQGYEGHTDDRSGVWAIVTAQADAEDPHWSRPERLCDGIMLNKPTVLSEHVLAKVGLAPFIEDVVGPELVPARKPAPDHVLAALERLGRRPEEAVMVGDGTTDVLSGRAAGVATIAVLWGYRTRDQLSEARPDRFAATVEELTELLAP